MHAEYIKRGPPQPCGFVGPPIEEPSTVFDQLVPSCFGEVGRAIGNIQASKTLSPTPRHFSAVFDDRSTFFEGIVLRCAELFFLSGSSGSAGSQPSERLF